jgi:hypothetical protein
MTTENALDLSKPLPAEMQARLEAALTALLASDPKPLRTFVTKERGHSVNEYPDVWRHAAAYLFECEPSSVTMPMRMAVKHACSRLIRFDHPKTGDEIITELLGLLDRVPT